MQTERGLRLVPLSNSPHLLVWTACVESVEFTELVLSERAAEGDFQNLLTNVHLFFPICLDSPKFLIFNVTAIPVVSIVDDSFGSVQML